MRILTFILALLPVLVYGQLPGGYGRYTIDPTNVPGKLLHLTPDGYRNSSGVYPTAAGQRIAYWLPEDDSGYTDSIYQDTDADRPQLFNTSPIAGAYFSKGDYLIANTNDIIATPLTLFVVANPDSLFDGRYLMYEGNGDGSGGNNEFELLFNRTTRESNTQMRVFIQDGPVNPDDRNYWALDYGHAWPTVEVYSITLHQTDDVYDVKLNGNTIRNTVTQSADVNASTLSGNFYLGRSAIFPAGGGGDDRQYRGYIYEVLLFDRILTEDSIQGIQNYLCKKYAVDNEGTPTIPTLERVVTPDKIRNGPELWFRSDRVWIWNDTTVTGIIDDGTINGNQYLECPNRPLINQDSLNGIQAITFDGVNDYCRTINSDTILRCDEDLSVFAVFKHLDGTASGYWGSVLSCGPGDNQKDLILFASEPVNKDRFYVCSGGDTYSWVFNTPLPMDDYVLAEFEHKYNDYKRVTVNNLVRYYDQSLTYDWSIAGASEYRTQMGYTLNAGGYAKMNVMEVIVFPHTLTPIEKTYIRNYLENRYNKKFDWANYNK